MRRIAALCLTVVVLGGDAQLEAQFYPIQVDGHGHLYVFPLTPDDWDSEVWPVDVYSAAGNLLLSGMIANRQWTRARGEFVYTRETDPETGERIIVRYRLVEPFE